MFRGVLTAVKPSYSPDLQAPQLLLVVGGAIREIGSMKSTRTCILRGQSATVHNSEFTRLMSVHYQRRYCGPGLFHYHQGFRMGVVNGKVFSWFVYGGGTVLFRFP